jgi:hypothetical protein
MSSPAPQTLDLLIPQGATWSVVLRWKADDVNVNLTNYTARMQIRASAEAVTTIEELTTANGGITLGGSAGTITLSLTDTETAALPATRAVYDLELVSAGGVVTRLVEGAVTITRNITR